MQVKLMSKLSARTARESLSFLIDWATIAMATEGEKDHRRRAKVI